MWGESPPEKGERNCPSARWVGVWGGGFEMVVFFVILKGGGVFDHLTAQGCSRLRTFPSHSLGDKVQPLVSLFRKNFYSGGRFWPPGPSLSEKGKGYSSRRKGPRTWTKGAGPLEKKLLFLLALQSSCSNSKQDENRIDMRKR